MKIGIPKEIAEGETRVAVIPPGVSSLKKLGHDVFVESGAGERARSSDEQYVQAGATVLPKAADLFSSSDVILKVQPLRTNPELGQQEADLLREGTMLIGYLAPFANPDLIRRLAERKITSFSMEFIPRITRAQSMDALTSMASLAGYKAVIMAADRTGKILPLMMTAAGTIAPANVLILGAGVAGLQAIATAKRLGARVEAFDPRPAVKEQVHSLGAQFLDMPVTEQVETAGGYAKEQSEEFLRREQETIASRLTKVDILITTAAIFGKRAPLLITAEMVQMMPPGSVIVDLAAEQGGNCELTQANETVEKHGVTIIGTLNIPSLLPVNASQMYSKNITTLFAHIIGKEGQNLDFEDEITRGACITHGGEIRNESIRNALQAKV